MKIEFPSIMPAPKAALRMLDRSCGPLWSISTLPGMGWLSTLPSDDHVDLHFIAKLFGRRATHFVNLLGLLTGLPPAQTPFRNGSQATSRE